MRFAVIACSQCRQPWAVEQRNASASCPSCNHSVELAKRTKLWEGESAKLAAEAAGAIRAEHAGAPPLPMPTRPEPRHDSVPDAAAAQAQGITNQSRRAEMVATWMTRLAGQPSHAELLEALCKAGLDATRAEREIVRMLAMDYITEPRAGTYRVLET